MSCVDGHLHTRLHAAAEPSVYKAVVLSAGVVCLRHRSNNRKAR